MHTLHQPEQVPWEEGRGAYQVFAAFIKTGQTHRRPDHSWSHLEQHKLFTQVNKLRGFVLGSISLGSDTHRELRILAQAQTQALLPFISTQALFPFI